MGNVRTSQSISGSNFNDTCDFKEENECVCSYKLKKELEITVQELSSITKIIQLLQTMLTLSLTLAHSVQRKPTELMT